MNPSTYTAVARTSHGVRRPRGDKSGLTLWSPTELLLQPNSGLLDSVPKICRLHSLLNNHWFEKTNRNQPLLIFSKTSPGRTKEWLVSFEHTKAGTFVPHFKDHLVPNTLPWAGLQTTKSDSRSGCPIQPDLE